MPDKFQTLWENIVKFFQNYIVFPISNITFIDFLDILVLSVLIYTVYKFIRERHATRLAMGVGLILLVYVVSDLLNMIAISSILKNFYAVGIMAICIIFQPELRDVLENVGSTSAYFKKKAKRVSGEDEKTLQTVEEISAAAFELSQKGEGALIVIERFGRLRNQMSEGTKIDAIVSRQLLCNIFVNKSPLHDGAVIIRDGRILAASSKSKTISENTEIAEGLGTRHRAALRISEVSDAVVVVVSEETGSISIANNKILKRDYNDIGANGTHKSTDLRDDLFQLMTGKTVQDMVSNSVKDETLVLNDELREVSEADDE